MKTVKASAPPISGQPATTKSLLLLITASAVLFTTWSFAVPVFEAPDEETHWEVIRYIHDAKRLPFYDAHMIEANQPPLYYTLLAPIAVPAPVPPSGIHVGPDGTRRQVLPPRSYMNSPTDLFRYWPIRVGRFLTIAMSLLTVALAFTTAIEITGRVATGWLAGGLVALLPQFTFRGMNVSNDACVTAASALGLYLIVRGVKTQSERTLVAATVAIGLAFLSKISALFLPLTYSLALLFDQQDWRLRLRRLTYLAIPALIVSPWLIRNYVLYDDLLATKQMFVAVPGLIDQKSITSPYFTTFFPIALLKSSIGVFGYMDVWLPDWVYVMYLAIGITAGAGLIWGLWHRQVCSKVVLVLLTAPVSMLILTIHLNLTFTQPQGRYLFPALTAAAVLATLGVEAIPRWTTRCSAVLLAGLTVANLGIMLFVIVPAYWSFPVRPVEIADISVPQILAATPTPGIAPGDVLTQSFVSNQDGLSKVEVLMTTWNASIPSGRLDLALKEGSSGTGRIAASSIPVRALGDGIYASFSFPRIARSKDRTYIVEITAADIPPGSKISVWLTKDDAYDPGSFSRNGEPSKRDAVFRTYFSPE